MWTTKCFTRVSWVVFLSLPLLKVSDEDDGYKKTVGESGESKIMRVATDIDEVLKQAKRCFAVLLRKV